MCLSTSQDALSQGCVLLCGRHVLKLHNLSCPHTQVLIQDILPSLETLRSRVRDFEEWAALGSAKERVGRVLVALDYTTCQR